MKTRTATLLVVFSLLISVNPLRAEWEGTGGFPGSVQALLLSGTNLFAGTWFPGVFLSTDNGMTWIERNDGLTNTDVFALATNGENLFAGTYGGGVFHSSNNGASWTAVNSGLTDPDVISLAVDGTRLFAGTWGGGVFLSTNNGASWSAVNQGLPSECVVQAFAAGGARLYAGTGGNQPAGVFVSTNDGASWTAVNSGLTELDVRALAETGSGLFAGTYGGGVFLSTDGGVHWSAVNNGLTYPGVLSFAAGGPNLFAGTACSGVFLSTSSGADWTEEGPVSACIYSLVFNDTYLFAGSYQGDVWRRRLSEMTTSVEELPASPPRDFVLAQNHPNPFSAMTAIRFAIPAPGWAVLKIHDVGGREIATLADGMMTPGVHQARWDAGHCPAGAYFYSLRLGGFVASRRMIRLK